MGRPKHREDMSKAPRAAAKAVRKPKDSKGKNSLSSLPTELQHGIVRHLPRTSLPTICLLNRHWHSVGSDELLRRVFPIPPRDSDQHGINRGDVLLDRAIRHFIDTNNADALQRFLDFRPKHPSFGAPTRSLLLADPASLRARVTKDEEERFCLNCYWTFGFWAVKGAFKYNDMSCMQLLIDHGLADYSWLLGKAVDDAFYDGRPRNGGVARPTPGPDSRGGHNSVLNWLLAYPPRHVVQAMLVMWGRPLLHPRLRPLGDWWSRDRSQLGDNMLIVVAGRGHPTSLQTIDELRMMVETLTDDATGRVIPEARQPVSRALRIARGVASMWPGTRPLVAEYLQSVCTWEDHQGRSGGSRGRSNTNNRLPFAAPSIILPPQDPFLHRLIDLKTFDEMLEPDNWLALQQADRDHHPLRWLVSTEFLADEEAARRMHCFKWSLRGLHSSAWCTYDLLHEAGAFRRWRCVEVVLDELGGKWPDELERFGSPDLVLCRAILDTVHGEPGCADGRIIRKLLRTGARNVKDFKGSGVHEKKPNDSPFRGGWFGWEPFRLAFVERQQDREQRVTPACMEMRDAILEWLSISDQNALDFLVGEPSKALYRESSRRRLKRLADKREKGRGAGGGSSIGESTRRSATRGSRCNSSAYP